ncbi:MAG: rhodanese-like domain-containing protein [Anaerolineae bacterium]|nr:MAG: rhodanese-like domain-containing protein [Anaerolineae bacterium]
MAGQGGNSAGLPAEISVQQAYEKYQQGTLLLDVRTQPEWDEYHAPNAILIPLDELPNRLSELPKDAEIVVICRSGNRSAVATDILRQNGFNATSVAGGMNAWRAAGYPVTP